MRELCPRSYDVVERAELQSLRVDLFDDDTSENPVTVTVRQDPDVGIPGVVYDCAMRLAAFVVDELFSKRDERRERRAFSGNAADEGGPVRVLELGAGTGACGCLLAAACARRNVEIHLTLTDRKPAALALCARNLAANPPEGSNDGSKNRATRRYAFGDPIDDLLLPYDAIEEEEHDDKHDDARKGRGTDDSEPSAGRRRRRDGSSDETHERRYDVILASDVLYDEASAAPLAGTLRDLLAPRPSSSSSSTRKTRPETTRARFARPVCFLAWRPRAASPNKASAVRAFLAACASRGLRVREAAREGKKPAGALVRASDATNRRGWAESLTARDVAERGVRVLRIEAVDDGE